MNTVANALLTTKAVHIKPDPNEFFTWTSGKRSPIYCDNRTLISYPHYRELITQSFCQLIKEKYKSVELIAGTATAGIPWASWIASELNLPMVYIRSKPKGHGLKSAIEGQSQEGQKTLIVEDLISTGKSSIEAFEHAKSAKLDVLAVLSIFNYGFSLAKENFESYSLKNESLCNLSELLEYARESSILNEKEVQTVLSWANEYR